MTDRELLELAAKAAGIQFSELGGGGARYAPQPGIMQPYVPWNPLTSSGDALRLAVNLDIVPRVINGVAFAWRDGVCDIQEPHNGDPYAATRRAIVLAAAAIGKEMP